MYSRGDHSGNSYWSWNRHRNGNGLRSTVDDRDTHPLDVFHRNWDCFLTNHWIWPWDTFHLFHWIWNLFPAMNWNRHTDTFDHVIWHWNLLHSFYRVRDLYSLHLLNRNP